MSYRMSIISDAVHCSLCIITAFPNRSRSNSTLWQSPCMHCTYTYVDVIVIHIIGDDGTRFKNSIGKVLEILERIYSYNS